MQFANPVALWGLVSIPAIIAMYLLKQKYKELPIPSLFLWAAALERSDAERPWQKLRRNSLMFLQLLAAFLLSLALAGPWVASGSRAGEIVIVLDCSLSMQATDAASTRFEQAKAEAVRLIERLGPDGRAALVVLNGVPYVAAGLSADKAALLARMQALTPSNTAGDVAAAASLAAAVAGQGSPEIVFLTDSEAPFEVDGYPVRRFLVGAGADNAAVTRVSPRRDGENVVCLVQVKNYGSSELVNGVALYVDDRLFAMQEIRLAAGEEADIYFTGAAGGTETQVWMAKLTEGDALEADDTAYACLYPETTRRTILYTRRNVFLESMLSILPNVDLYTGDPDDAEGGAGYFLYVYDGVLPQEWPADGHVLVFNPPVGNALIETGKAVDISAAALNPEGTEGLFEAADFAVSQAKALTVPDWAEISLSANGVPLVISGQQDGRKIMVFAFDLHDTDLPLRKEFPIFMYELSKEFMPSEALAGQELLVGAPVELQPAPDMAAYAGVILPNGTAVQLAPPYPVSPLVQTHQAGIYIFRQSNGTETRDTPFAVNLAAGAEADLRRETPAGYTSEASETNRVAGSLDLTIYFLAAVLVCMMGEWWLYSRR